MTNRKLGIAVIGVGGAVGTTMFAGLELIRKAATGTQGLPLAGITDAELAPYDQIEVAGWDLYETNLAKAAEEHDVLTLKQYAAVEAELKEAKPWPGIGNPRFVNNIAGQNLIAASGHRAAIDRIKEDIDTFRKQCESLVVINLASTEKLAEEGNEVFNSLADLERALDENSKDVSPAILYAYAAISAGVPYGNFTPSVAADIPALIELSEKKSVPIAGKDGKTGQTFIKSVLAPAFRSRALKVEGWFSTNILGNRDGLVLSDEESLASKVKTKSSLLDDILGYRVEDHIVDIRYYRPRKDNKEAWDNIDLTGFLGQPMQLKVNFLCRDSILAAPLAIEIARCLDLAQRRAESGIQEQLSAFFKLPMYRSAVPEQAFHKQETVLLKWLQG